MTHTLLPIAYAGPISHWIPICKEQAIVWKSKTTIRNKPIGIAWKSMQRMES